MPPKKRGGRRGKASKTSEETPPPLPEQQAVESTPQPKKGKELGKPQPTQPEKQIAEAPSSSKSIPKPVTKLPGPKESELAKPGPSSEQTITKPPSPGKQIVVKPPGTLGRKINIESNHLQLNLGNLKKAYLYDVKIEPEKFPKKMLRKVMQLVQQSYYPKNHPGYDGQKLLFSARRLPLDNDIFEGSVVVNEKEFKVSLKLSGELDFSSSDNLLQKNIITQCIEVVFRQTYTSSFITMGRRFFLEPEKSRSYPLGEGAEMYLGGYQAAVRGSKPLMNVDVAHKAFTTATSIKDLILEMFSTYKQPLKEQDLRNFNFSQWQRDQLNGYLRGLKINYQIPNHPGSKKTYKVNQMDAPPNQAKFTHDGRVITVEQYYKIKWHYTIKFPNLPTLWVGTKGQILLPLECCTLKEGQPLGNSQMTDKQRSQMIKHSATPTQERKAKIEYILQKAGYNQNPCVREFGFSVGNEFEKLIGRVLPPPSLNYGDGKDTPYKGVWRGKKYISPVTINKWTIVGVGLQPNWVNRDISDLSRKIIDFGREKGMVISQPEPPEFIRSNVQELWKYLDRKKTLDLVIVVIAPFPKELHDWVKQVAELSVGCLTQCIKSDTLKKLSPSTVNNILLKINSKLNGTNHTISDLDLITKEPTMIMGADVTHPTPQEKILSPSVVAVTASHDLQCAKYNISTCLQKPRTEMSEMIQDLETITLEKLKFFVDNTKKLPKRIYFFRDGVSDGEFERVSKIEIQAIFKACNRFQKGYKPKVTFLVVQKRHHTRFFPLDRNASDDPEKNFNVPAGTCVDTVVVDPTLQNFYLVSHASIKGVAKPTKYCTLYDDNNLSNDDVQILTYYLCYLFIRCNRAVSYPAPTYYAHLAADRAKGYLRGKNWDIENLDQKLIKIKDNIALNNPMFFS